MTKSQNTKNEQLTEQWKKGELINGKKYYITFFDSEPFEATFRCYEAMLPYWKFEANGKQYCDENGYDCVKVLAPVPSYEKWQAKLEENAQLKELLKECRNTLERRCYIEKDLSLDDFIKQIDEVLQ